MVDLGLDRTRDYYHEILWLGVLRVTGFVGYDRDGTALFLFVWSTMIDRWSSRGIDIVIPTWGLQIG